MAEAAAGAPRRKRPPPRLATVAAIEPITPKVVKVTFEGDELGTFSPPRPGAHIKLLFVPKGVAWDRNDPEAPRPPSRTYTPRCFDPATRRLDVEFVLHGEGLATDWLKNAKPGDPMFIGGPGGGYDVPAECRDLVVVADETAMPAAGMILEAMPPGCNVTALCEVPDAAEERPLSPRVSAKPVWLHRNGAQAGTPLERAAAWLNAPDGAYWWIACEAGTMRRIRMLLQRDKRVAPQLIHTRGYWRLGETNYPDHDYGND